MKEVKIKNKQLSWYEPECTTKSRYYMEALQDDMSPALFLGLADVGGIENMVFTIVSNYHTKHPDKLMTAHVGYATSSMLKKAIDKEFDHAIKLTEDMFVNMFNDVVVTTNHKEPIHKPKSFDDEGRVILYVTTRPSNSLHDLLCTIRIYKNDHFYVRGDFECDEETIENKIHDWWINDDPYTFDEATDYVIKYL